MIDPNELKKFLKRIKKYVPVNTGDYCDCSDCVFYNDISKVFKIINEASILLETLKNTINKKKSDKEIILIFKNSSENFNKILKNKL